MANPRAAPRDFIEILYKALFDHVLLMDNRTDFLILFSKRLHYKNKIF